MYETNIYTNHLNLLEDGYFVYGLIDPKTKERIEKTVNTRRGKYVGVNNKLFGTTRPQEVTDKMLNSCKRKLSFEQILEIRRLWATGKYKQKELATIFNAKRQHISKIVNNKAGHIPSNYKPK